MQNTNKISQLENLLPYGGKKEIARLTGISQATVTRFFQGKVNNMGKYEAILEVSIQIINDYKNKHSKMFNDLLQD